MENDFIEELSRTANEKIYSKAEVVNTLQYLAGKHPESIGELVLVAKTLLPKLTTQRCKDVNVWLNKAVNKKYVRPNLRHVNEFKGVKCAANGHLGYYHYDESYKEVDKLNGVLKPVEQLGPSDYIYINSSDMKLLPNEIDGKLQWIRKISIYNDTICVSENDYQSAISLKEIRLIAINNNKLILKSIASKHFAIIMGINL